MGGKKSNKIREFLRKFKTVRTWQLAVVLVPLAFLAATLLRFEHLRMTELRAAVLVADEVGDLEALEENLTRLQDYTFSHMVINVTESNGVQEVTFGTGPFYLEYSYQRAAEAAIRAAEESLTDDSNPNGNIYQIVTNICRAEGVNSGWNAYLECWTRELEKFPAAEELGSTTIAASIPSTELYRKNYASPIWAPTVTGWVVLICLILFVIIVVRLGIWLVLTISLIFLDK